VEQIGALPLRHILDLVHDIVTVTEDEIRAAVRLTAIRARLVAEPGGAVAVAAWLFRRDLPPARAPVAVLSGGNIAPALLTEILAAPAGPALRPGTAVQDVPRPVPG
jgi:threonine dehydratase